MRIKFIEHEDYDCHCIGDEWQGELKAVGHTIVSGHRIAANGVLKPFVKDITVYKAEIDEDGKEVKIEVLPEEIPELPTYDGNTIPQIKEFMVAEDISYSYLDGKQDLLDKIHIYYGLPM